MRPSVPGAHAERKAFCAATLRHTGAARVAVARAEEHLKLVRLQGGGRGIVLGGWPPAERPLREALLTEPEALPVVDEQFDGGTPAVAEDEDRPGERVGRKVRPAQLRQSVDASTEVGRLDGHQHAHLRSDLDHAGLLRKASTSRMTSSALPAASRTVSRTPWGSETSTTSSPPTGGAGGRVAVNSTNAPGTALAASGPPWAARRGTASSINAPGVALTASAPPARPAGSGTLS